MYSPINMNKKSSINYNHNDADKTAENCAQAEISSSSDNFDYINGKEISITPM